MPVLKRKILFYPHSKAANRPWIQLDWICNGRIRIRSDWIFRRCMDWFVLKNYLRLLSGLFVLSFDRTHKFIRIKKVFRIGAWFVQINSRSESVKIYWLSVSFDWFKQPKWDYCESVKFHWLLQWKNTDLISETIFHWFN